MRLKFPKKSSLLKNQSRCRWFAWILPASGLLALIWFLLRVIPKPSRAAYPCQRAAFPLASGFIVWFAGAIGSLTFIRRARRYLVQSRYTLCVVLVAVSVGLVWFTQSITAEQTLLAGEPVANSPIGDAKGGFIPGELCGCTTRMQQTGTALEMATGGKATIHIKR